MADVFTKEQRSKVMAAIHGRGNKATEWRLRARLMAAGVSGWRVNARDIMGKPDFAFDRARLLIFIDGCFWHHCTICRNLPQSNAEFWRNKILGNAMRDRHITKRLRRQKWHVLRFWEHELKNEPARVVRRIKQKLNQIRAY